MRYLSLFSGIEAASAAWIPLGWECVAVAEIEPFPSRVIAHHYPDVPNLGDVTRITDAQVAALGPIDLIVGGFPCQDLSVAGKRAGMKENETRSGLFYDAMRIVTAALEHNGLRWLALENVPGLFSSRGGADFAALVGNVVGCGFGVPDTGWQNAGFAAGPRGLLEWATLDAQFFGVAQRRRRVFLVGDFGDWPSRAPVLLERESLCGNPAPRRGSGKVAPTIPSRSTAGGGLGTDFDCGGGLIPQVANTLTASMHKGVNTTCDAGQTMIAHTLRGEGFDASEDGTGRGTPLVPVAQAMQVRRLTPTECERLQGFPEGWTDIKPNGKPTPDGSRYKALGNSMAVPCMVWLGQRIQQVSDAGKTTPPLRCGDQPTHDEGAAQGRAESGAGALAGLGEDSR